VTNKGGGTITGVVDGVYIAGGGTVTNAGTISGTIASVEFAGSGTNTLTLETGSTLIGDAIGSTASGATNALVLEGHGTASNNFDNFNTLDVQANASWTLGGDSTFGATTVSSGTLIVAGDVSGGATTLGDPAGDIGKLVIASTGTWDILDASGIGLGSSASSLITNSGLFEKTGGSGTSAIAPQLVNNGSVLASSGTLDGGFGSDSGPSRGDASRRAIRPTEASKAAVCYVPNTSTPAVRRVRGRYYAPASHCLATKVSTKPTRGTLNG
jgi:hypothetical protein